MLRRKLREDLIQQLKDFNEFKEILDIIVANRLYDEIKDVLDKLYTRDLFSKE